MSDPRLDRLQVIFRRALARVALIEQGKKALKTKNSLREISEDYAGRLADKGRFRALLSDESQDGLRFRFYFQYIEPSTGLEQLRAWIDDKMEEADRADAQKVESARQTSIPEGPAPSSSDRAA